MMAYYLILERESLKKMIEIGSGASIEAAFTDAGIDENSDFADEIELNVIPKIGGQYIQSGNDYDDAIKKICASGFVI